MEEEFTYWEYHYVSCEGNDRWNIARCPSHWSEWQVEVQVMKDSGCGDDPAEFKHAFEVGKPEDDNYIDFSDCEV